MKNRVSFEQLDVGKELSTWKKPELEAYPRSLGISLTSSNV